MRRRAVQWTTPTSHPSYYQSAAADAADALAQWPQPHLRAIQWNTATSQYSFIQADEPAATFSATLPNDPRFVGAAPHPPQLPLQIWIAAPAAAPLLLALVPHSDDTNAAA